MDPRRFYLARSAGLSAALLAGLLGFHSPKAMAQPTGAVNSAVQSAIQSARDDVQRRLRDRDRTAFYYRRDAAIDYCMRRFRSYDPGSMTYLGYDGRRHRCPR
jgi:hypothetical protein